MAAITIPVLPDTQKVNESVVPGATASDPTAASAVTAAVRLTATRRVIRTWLRHRAQTTDRPPRLADTATAAACQRMSCQRRHNSSRLASRTGSMKLRNISCGLGASLRAHSSGSTAAAPDCPAGRQVSTTVVPCPGEENDLRVSPSVSKAPQDAVPQAPAEGAHLRRIEASAVVGNDHLDAA